MSEVTFKSFASALEALRKAIALFEEHRGGELYVSMRNSMILEFEISFGLCRTMIERCLVDVDGDDPLEIEEMSYAEVIRTANERGLVRVDWEMWSQFRQARNLTAHAYSEPKAEEIALLVPKFYIEAKYLYDKMVGRAPSI
jgi:nucleotidyltransferase substrate binding protein (TIGR01987 family)